MFDRLPEGRWWDIGIDLVTGCTPVSPGCAHCWSAEKTHRAGNQRNPKIQARYGGLTVAQASPPAIRFTGEVRPQWQDLAKIGAARKPQVYTFWNDLFHEGISFDLADGQEKFMDEVIIKILTRPQHFYIICTKRPERALEYFLSRQGDTKGWPGASDILARRLMLMTTAENQEMADLRVPILLQIPGVMHGVSVEPGLGGVDSTNIYCPGEIQPFWATTGGHKFNALQDDEDHYYDSENHLDWVICGGETGPHARPMHPDIPRKLRDDCVAAGVPFFFKSWGEYLHETQGYDISLPRPFPNCEINNGPGSRKGYSWPDDTWSIRVGKKAAGRLLDGRTWDEVPTIPPGPQKAEGREEG